MLQVNQFDPPREMRKERWKISKADQKGRNIVAGAERVIAESSGGVAALKEPGKEYMPCGPLETLVL